MLLAAKVLVISRLLHKKLSDQSQFAEFTESTRLRLAKLRRILLASIDRRLESPSNDPNQLAEAMCAFSLAASASLADVLRQFLQIRIQSISTHTQMQDINTSTILDTLRLWMGTLQNASVIFPQQLSTALANLKSVPLFMDPEVRSIVNFNYDVHEQWIGDDLNNFIPYIRHDDLQSTSIKAQLATWAPAALSASVTGIQRLLSTMESPVDCVLLRKQCLDLWLSTRRNVVVMNRDGVLDQLRDTFQSRLLELVKIRCVALTGVVSIAAGTLSGKVDNITAIPTLWGDSLISLPTSGGASHFIDALQVNVYGENDSVVQVLEMYRKWITGITEIETAIARLRSTKWDEDTDDIEDDDELDDKNTLLSKDDPNVITTELETATRQSLLTLQGSLGQMAEEKIDSAAKAAFVLRVTRGIKKEVTKAHGTPDFASAFIPVLHSKLCRFVLQPIMDQGRRSITKSKKGNKVLGRILWDGSPALPVSPSPWVYNFLHALHHALAHHGSDLWSLKAVVQLKTQIRAELANMFQDLGSDSMLVDGSGPQSEHYENFKCLDSSQDNSSAPSAETPSLRNSTDSQTDRQIQQLFDLAYLKYAASSPSKSDLSDPFHAFEQKTESECGLRQVEVKRLRGRAAEYWKRTSGLFALLAGEVV